MLGACGENSMIRNNKYCFYRDWMLKKTAYPHFLMDSMYTYYNNMDYCPVVTKLSFQLY